MCYFKKTKPNRKMIMPSDKEYKVTKQIMLGKTKMQPDFKELADFIYQTFGVKTINIIYDTIGKEKRPRLNICFEFETEKQLFNENGGHYNFDSQKQKIISDKFKQIAKEFNVAKEKGILDFLSKSESEKYRTENIWVFYSAFEPIAMNEANENVPQNKVTELEKELSKNDLWKISRCFSGTTFFVFKDNQINQFKNSEIIKLWADKYFDLLEPFNEFGYFKRDKFEVYIDSKENFDKNYESNWYYYYK